MKKILGLDLGVSSIGWALIKEENEQPTEIIGMGVRIIPLDTDENDEFTRGSAITKNQKRTQKRSMRRNYYRYILRRTALTKELKKHGMFDENLFKLPKLELWQLRAKAATEQVSIKELGRILYHLNQKRGYQPTKGEATEDSQDNKKDTQHVKEIKNRYQQLKEENKTISQKFFEELSKNPFYRTKQQIFPREAYIEEFDKIMKKQQEFYPDVLSDELINHIRNDIIYYQRPLKSQKGLVSICEFEGFHVLNKEGKKIFTGPKVAHRSNPLFQIEKIWESINNIVIKNKKNEDFPITLEQKQKIFEYLNENPKLTLKELFKILGIKERSGWYGNKMLYKGIQGNVTKTLIKQAIGNDESAKKWLQFNLKTRPNANNESKTYLVNKDNGEVISDEDRLIIDESFINEPLYQLWHVIYSISDINECKKVLINKMGLSEEVADRLSKIDFAKLSYGNKSIKAIRKILPYLMKGYQYSDASYLAGYNHSNSLTSEEVMKKRLLEKLPLLSKNALRQPVVEKILNQMIHIVNDIIDEKRGWVTREERDKGLFEIRIELARELKQTKEERNETFKNISKIEEENKKIEKKLQELGVRATRKNIIKYRLFNEISENKINALCIYTGKMFSLSDALNGDNIDVDHIIPRSLLFDDSQSNKTLTFSYINQEKGDQTAYDYMASKGETALNDYIERVNKLYENKIISKAKRNKLLMPASKIPQDFINRQLRETAYLSRKAREILSQISKNVWATSGNVTSYLRRLWGWDDILMNLQLKRIKELITDPLSEGITEKIEIETSDGQKHSKEIIKDWSKRDDHRHHAIDALVVACTKQGYIQRVNTISAQATRDELFKEVNERKEEFREQLSLLDKYFILHRPFTTSQVEREASKIIVSYKPGKKVATYGKRFIRKNGKRIKVQDHIIVPRGPLSEEYVYGKIKVLDKNKSLKYLFENPHLIFKPHIKELVEKRLEEFDGDIKKALASTKKNPIYLPNKSEPVILEYATCFKEEYVLKYPVTKITLKDIPYIVDNKIRELIKERLEQFKGNTNEAFKEPIYIDKEKQIPIRTVRMFTGLSGVEPIKYNDSGMPISFVKPGNNHHIAIYVDKDGKKYPHLCTFWHAVERKKYEIPVIIDNPQSVWDKILSSSYQYPQSFLEKLPNDNWELLFTLQQNEYFLLHENKEYLDDILRRFDYQELPKNIFRVQKIFYNGKQLEIFFRHIYETKLIDNEWARKQKKYYPVKSLGALEKLNPIKIRVSRLGEIEAIGIK
ncbi:type II CRISPR RNA-guided endonuclease Cas9 [Thermoflavifilum thermophilum]|uniref:CRISPR-associated endonuclease Cas9 n=1 Tax=Thermoflavifilum thermophilum TaxID=1393122 RepID=A0A1I7NCB5_9BACT|nr:type II CRISPR RNA-guided endonuclease Cas9 [Thermoflavifilum thermophilum]SFV32310.1 CRISPR-associated endonuclease Csn1 [Thermoflavifilum thermophilum]